MNPKYLKVAFWIVAPFVAPFHDIWERLKFNPWAKKDPMWHIWESELFRRMKFYVRFSVLNYQRKSYEN